MVSITAIIFDFVGVMGKQVIPFFAARLHADLGISPEKTPRVWSGYNQQLDCGALPEEKFWSYIRRDLAIPTDYPLEERFLGLIKLDRGMITLAQRLKSNGYAIGLLSNFYSKAAEKLKGMHELQDILDISIISYEVKAIKPEPVKEAYADEELRIYSILEYRLREHGVHIPSRASIIFIDDKEGPVRSAAQYGLAAIRFDGDMEKLTVALRQHGVRI